MNRSRLRLLPFRSLRAMTDPRHAAQRLLRVLTRVLGCAQARCELTELACVLERRAVPRKGLRRYRVALQWQGRSLGQITVRTDSLQWSRARPDVCALASGLSFLLAVHAGPQRLRGVALGARRLHDLNNAVNALSLQIGAIETLLERGQAGEAAQFAQRSAVQAERLTALLSQLRHA